MKTTKNMKKIIAHSGMLLFMLLILSRLAIAQNDWKRACGVVQPPSAPLLKPDTIVDGDSVIIIPTVFHILTEGGAENVSKTQILYALQFLNQDFNRQNPDTMGIPEVFQQLRGNPKVEFRLARLDPQGNCTDGIERIYTPLTGAYDNFLQLQPTFSWDHTRYLNIYVMKWIDYQNSPLYTGISYIAPVDSGQNYPAQWDALAVVYGEGGDLSGIPPESPNHLLGHEMGHYLGLQHIFGIGAGCSDDDYVFDTPLQDSPSNGCPNFPHISCSNGPNGDMFNNLMDYSACTSMFSKGQVDRMRTCLSNNEWRTGYWTSANLTSTGVDTEMPACAIPPLADFGYGNYAGWLCAGQPIQFYEASSVNATTYQWEFTGGVPSTSSDAFASVVFADTGLHSVRLVAGNSFGMDTVEKMIRIRLAEVYYPLNVNSMTESFEDPVFNQQIPQWLLGGKEWSVTNLASYSGTNSIRLDDGIKYFSVFFTHTFDLSQIPGSGRKLEFKVACGLSSLGSITGGLRVTWKRPCEYNRQVMSGDNNGGEECGALHAGDALLPDELKTATTNSAFIPNSSQWKTITLDIPDTLTGEIQIGFDWGSFTVTNKLKGLYIDDIKLLSGNTGIAENASGILLNIFPNPTGDLITFDFGNLDVWQVEVFIYNTTGVLIKHFSSLQSAQVQIPVDEIGSDGMYFYTVRADNGQVATGKFMIQR